MEQQISPKHILLIDDDEDDREIFQIALSNVNNSIKCTVSDNAKIALSMLSQHEIVPDIIFLDLNMPVMTGQQFLVEIKKENYLSNIPVVILSTSSHAATIELTKELGAYKFLTKPDNFEDLVTAISSVLI